ncbi:hypothetical protein P2H44_09105 [Albimonas sp. CAU 1670]|uniref:hypothetical protein n=1 Tax=Albimonas sp. CAU 1670 TaxID=3032599 RepID=UPI0023DBDDAE|nr:hypothetical protein [Albimonas sp. CAU 1670]MDF2232709.1 hypothetical protein [Albimonas sp. CAU 1670]
MFTTRCAAAALLISIVAAPAQALVLWDTYLERTEANSLYTSDTGGQETVQRVSFATDVSATQFSVSGIFFFGDRTFAGPDDFTVNIYADAGGAVGALAQSVAASGATRSAPGGQLNNSDFLRFDAAFDTAVEIAAGTWWISVAMDTSGDDDVWIWAGANVASERIALRSTWGSGAFGTPFERQMSLLIEGEAAAVPAPPAIALLGGALGLAGWAARRRRAA